MNFIFTIVTLACGMLVGVIATFVAKNKKSKTLTGIAWLGVLFILFLTMVVGYLCEQQTNSKHFLPFMPWVTTATIVIYGIFWGIVISLSSEVKQAFKEKNENLTLAGAAGFTVLPLALWIVLSIGTPYSCWSCLAFSVFLGFTVASVLWFFFSITCWMLKTNKKNPCF